MKYGTGKYQTFDEFEVRMCINKSTMFFFACHLKRLE